MHFPHFRFVLFNLKIFVKIVTLYRFYIQPDLMKWLYYRKVFHREMFYSIICVE